MLYRLSVVNEQQLLAALNTDCKYIYTPLNLLNKCEHDNRIIIIPPVFIGGDEDVLSERLKSMKQCGFTAALAHTIGHIPLIKQAGMSVHGGMRLNVTNSVSAKMYAELGVSDLTLSVELSIQRLKAINSPVPSGFIAYGKLPLMLLRRVECYDSDVLIDRKGMSIPIVKNEKEAELLNPLPLMLCDRMNEFACLDFAVLMLSKEDGVDSILSLYQSGIMPSTGNNSYTRGLYYK